MARFDILTVGNMIGGRQGWAYICNSNRFNVIKVDLDKEQEYDTYKTYEQVRVITTSRNGCELLTNARLACDEGKWKLTSWGCCISGSFNYFDAMELVEAANLPQVKEGEVVALAQYSEKNHSVFLQLFKIGKVNIHCTTVATLEELTEEEMKDIAMDAEMWCRR